MAPTAARQAAAPAAVASSAPPQRPPRWNLLKRRQRRHQQQLSQQQMQQPQQQQQQGRQLRLAPAAAAVAALAADAGTGAQRCAAAGAFDALMSLAQSGPEDPELAAQVLAAIAAMLAPNAEALPPAADAAAAALAYDVARVCLKGAPANAAANDPRLVAVRRAPEALPVLDAAIKVDARNPLARYERASVLLTIDRPHEALAELNVLREIEPREGSVFVLLAKVHRRLNQPGAAALCAGIGSDMGTATELEGKAEDESVHEG